MAICKAIFTGLLIAAVLFCESFLAQRTHSAWAHSNLATYPNPQHFGNSDFQVEVTASNLEYFSYSYNGYRGDVGFELTINENTNEIQVNQLIEELNGNVQFNYSALKQ